MNFDNLLLCFAYLLGAAFFYFIHRWWLSGRDKDDSYGTTRSGTINHWILIIILLIVAFIYLLKSIFNL